MVRYQRTVRVRTRYTPKESKRRQIIRKHQEYFKRLPINFLCANKYPLKCILSKPFIQTEKQYKFVNIGLVAIVNIDFYLIRHSLIYCGATWILVVQTLLCTMKELASKNASLHERQTIQKHLDRILVFKIYFIIIHLIIFYR